MDGTECRAASRVRRSRLRSRSQHRWSPRRRVSRQRPARPSYHHRWPLMNRQRAELLLVSSQPRLPERKFQSRRPPRESQSRRPSRKCRSRRQSRRSPRRWLAGGRPSRCQLWRSPWGRPWRWQPRWRRLHPRLRPQQPTSRRLLTSRWRHLSWHRWMRPGPQSGGRHDSRPECAWQRHRPRRRSRWARGCRPAWGCRPA